MNAGDVGVTFVFEPNLPNQPPPLSLTGLTCKGAIIGPAPGNLYTLVPLTVASDGNSASFVTTGAEFPIQGVYKCQLKVYKTGPSNPPISGGVFYQTVGESLPQ